MSGKPPRKGWTKEELDFELAAAGVSTHNGATASKLFDEAYAAADAGDFETALKVLKDIADDGQNPLLQALLQAQSDTDQGHTFLHRAAYHGDCNAIRALMGLGADASLLNNVSESALDVAIACGHEAATALLRVWVDAWAGWGVEDLTVLACLCT